MTISMTASLGLLLCPESAAIGQQEEEDDIISLDLEQPTSSSSRRMGNVFSSAIAPSTPLLPAVISHHYHPHRKRTRRRASSSSSSSSSGNLMPPSPPLRPHMMTPSNDEEEASSRSTRQPLQRLEHLEDSRRRRPFESLRQQEQQRDFDTSMTSFLIPPPPPPVPVPVPVPSPVPADTNSSKYHNSFETAATTISNGTATTTLSPSTTTRMSPISPPSPFPRRPCWVAPPATLPASKRKRSKKWFTSSLSSSLVVPHHSHSSVTITAGTNNRSCNNCPSATVTPPPPASSQTTAAEVFLHTTRQNDTMLMVQGYIKLKNSITTSTPTTNTMNHTIPVNYTRTHLFYPQISQQQRQRQQQQQQQHNYQDENKEEIERVNTASPPSTTISNDYNWSELLVGLPSSVTSSSNNNNDNNSTTHSSYIYTRKQHPTTTSTAMTKEDCQQFLIRGYQEVEPILSPTETATTYFPVTISQQQLPLQPHDDDQQQPTNNLHFTTTTTTTSRQVISVYIPLPTSDDSSFLSSHHGLRTSIESLQSSISLSSSEYLLDIVVIVDGIQQNDNLISKSILQDDINHFFGISMGHSTTNATTATTTTTTTTPITTSSTTTTPIRTNKRHGSIIDNGDGNTNDMYPFDRLPTAETIIVESIGTFRRGGGGGGGETNDDNIDNDMDTSSPSETRREGYDDQDQDELVSKNSTPEIRLSLILKRNSHGAINSQRWWLWGRHGIDTSSLPVSSSSDYMLVVPCGTIVQPTTISKFISRLDEDPNIVAVTGYRQYHQQHHSHQNCDQETSCYDGYYSIGKLLLRQVQSFQLLSDQCLISTSMDRMGIVSTLFGSEPSSCSMFKTSAMNKKIKEQYLEVISSHQTTGNNILRCNAQQFAMDRILSFLVLFGNHGDDEDNDDNADHNNPITTRKEISPCYSLRSSLVQDAVLSSPTITSMYHWLDQCRTCNNGKLAVNIHVLREGLLWEEGISRSTYSSIGRKVLALTLISLSVVQEIYYRECAPAMVSFAIYIATISLSVFKVFSADTDRQNQSWFMVLFTSNNDEEEKLQKIWEAGVSPEIISRNTQTLACSMALVYLTFYAIFMVAHTPQTMKLSGNPYEGTERQRNKYQDPTKYRPLLVALSMILQGLFVSLLFLISVTLVLIHLEWRDIPMSLKVWILSFLAPLGLAILNDISDHRGRASTFIAMIRATPCYLLTLPWTFAILPSYTAARMSDVTLPLSSNFTRKRCRHNGHDYGDIDSFEAIRHLKKKEVMIGFLDTTGLVLGNILLGGTFIALSNLIGGFLSIIIYLSLGIQSVVYGIAIIDQLVRLAHQAIICSSRLQMISGFGNHRSNQPTRAQLDQFFPTQDGGSI